MATLSPDVTAAVASLQARWGAAAPRVAGTRPAGAGDCDHGRRAGPDPLEAAAPAPIPVPARPDDRVIHTGFAALDAILGPGGLPRSASVAIRGDGSSGRTTLVLRLAAEAQAPGSIVAWLDLSRSFDPVEAVARGVRPRMARGHHPGDARRGPGHRGRAAGRPLGRPARPGPARWPAGRHGQPGPDRRPARPAGRARPARRRRSSSSSSRPDSPAASRPPSPSRPASASSSPGGRGSGSGATSSASGRRRWSPATATARRGKRATLRILYAEGGERDACLRRDDLLIDQAPVHAPAIRPNGPTAMRLLHLHRPHLPLQLARARASEPFPPGPLVLGGRPWDPGPVIDASPDARALGVRRGMPLGSAHRLVPEATFVDPDPDADRATVEAAFEALAAFSPGIAGSADPLDAGVRAVRGPGRRPRAAVGTRAGPRRAAGRGARPGPAGERGRCGRPTRHPGRDRRDPLRGDGGRRPGPARRPDPRPARWRGGVPRPASVRPADPGPRRPGPADPLRAAPDRRRRRAAAVGARRPVRRGGRPDPRPGPRRGARAVPAAPGAGAPRARPAHRARRSRTSSRSASSSIGWPRR